MAELNLEDNILKLTLGDIVQSFSEEQLQTQMPIFMQDIDAETKDLIDTYQGYLVSGNFSEAETYRSNNPALETRIWDAFKANSMMAYASYTYMYAKDQNQQCIFSSTEPVIRTMENDLGAVDGDIWFQYSSTIVDEEEVIDYAIPFNTYVLKDGVWCKFTVTPELDIATESDIEEIYNPEVVELTNPEALIDETGLKHFKVLIDSDLGEKLKTTSTGLETKIGDLSTLKTTSKTSTVDAINECFQYASDGKEAIAAAITGKGITGITSTTTFADMAAIISKSLAKIGDTVTITITDICHVAGTFQDGSSKSQTVSFGMEFVEPPTVRYNVTGSGHFGNHDPGFNYVTISDITTKTCHVTFSWGDNTGNNYNYSKWVDLYVTGRKLMV